MVCFTGSYATGRRVARAVADRLVRVQLELGGKDARVRVRRRRRRGGRARGRRGRVLQRRPVVQRDRAGLRARGDLRPRSSTRSSTWSRAYRVGDPDRRRTPTSARSRVPSSSTCSTRRSPTRSQRGAQGAVRRRSHRSAGQLVRADRAWSTSTRRMSVMRDESFGPVIGVQRVRDDAEATARMDDTEFGLGASVFTARSRAGRADPRASSTSATPTGTRADRSCVRLPWAGRRHSGPRRVDVGVGRARVRPREGLAPRFLRRGSQLRLCARIVDQLRPDDLAGTRRFRAPRVRERRNDGDPAAAAARVIVIQLRRRRDARVVHPDPDGGGRS